MSNAILRVAVIGSGPAGLFAAAALTKNDNNVHVDIFERLPTPYGLIRFGVAPDHPHTKNVIRRLSLLADDPRISLYANVMVGRDLEVAELAARYHVLVFAGGMKEDRKLNIPGESTPGVHPAIDFIGWVNGNPDYSDVAFDLSGPNAIVIGNGNVALDTVRLLAKSADELAETDIADHASRALAGSGLQKIYLIGRRGPAQAAFTYREIKELSELPNCDLVVNPADMAVTSATHEELHGERSVQRRRIFELLESISNRPRRTVNKSIELLFFRSPVEIHQDGGINAVRLEINRLDGSAGQQRAHGTGEFETIPCNIVFRAIGFRGAAVTGVPYDEKRGIFPNIDGRITRNGKCLPGYYAVGWIKRGPVGLIGTNKADSTAVVKRIIEDADTLRSRNVDDAPMTDLLSRRGIPFITFNDWKKIDEAEIERGRSGNKPREKFTTAADILACLGRTQ